MIEGEIRTFRHGNNDPQRIKQADIRKGFGASSAFPIKDYPELVAKVATLGFKNRGYFLLYRGQPEDFYASRGSEHSVSLYPSIFRSDKVKNISYSKEWKRRWQDLKEKTKQLLDRYPQETGDQREALRYLLRNEELCWAILQHYEKCLTPYLDLTHSLRVAASFATQNSTNGYVYVFGMPYPHGTISHYIDQDIVLIHLQSACHPSAKRPHFQEGWLAGSYYLNPDDDNRAKQNFSRRLLAKFHINNAGRFWSKEFPRLPDKALKPGDDKDFSWVL